MNKSQTSIDAWSIHFFEASKQPSTMVSAKMIIVTMLVFASAISAQKYSPPADAISSFLMKLSWSTEWRVHWWEQCTLLNKSFVQFIRLLSFLLSCVLRRLGKQTSEKYQNQIIIIVLRFTCSWQCNDAVASLHCPQCTSWTELLWDQFSYYLYFFAQIIITLQLQGDFNDGMCQSLETVVDDQVSSVLTNLRDSSLSHLNCWMY